MFNRRLLVDSGGEQQTYSVLEIHVDTPDGDHVRSARVELIYNGESNLANTDNNGIAVFYGVPTGTEISYTITAAGYKAATGKWIIPTDVEYETEYVVLSPTVLEIHVDTSSGDHVRSARVELIYNGVSNLANTDNNGIAVFYGVPTGTEISYTITAAGYNAATGKWIIPTDVEYETEYVVLSPSLPAGDTDLWHTTAADDGGFKGTFDVIIPAGVNVVFVGGGINGSIDGEPCYCRMYSNFSGKTWFSASGENSAAATNYIGVTPLKTYRITVDYGSEIDGTGGSAYIRYSQRINAVMPNVTDY